MIIFVHDLVRIFLLLYLPSFSLPYPFFFVMNLYSYWKLVVIRALSLLLILKIYSTILACLLSGMSLYALEELLGGHYY